MFRNCCYFEMFLLLLFSHMQWNGPSHIFQTCSRSNSRLVRSFIHKKILPVFYQYKISPPLNCPFHTKRDILWWPNAEQHFRKKWTCPQCGKTFLEDEDLVHHWDDSHSHTISQPEDAICLDSLCDIFRCDVIVTSLKHLNGNTTHVPYHMENTNERPLCNEKNMFTLQQKCKTVIHNCLLDKLASISAKDFIDIEDELDTSICSYLTCHTYWKKTFTEFRRVPITFCIILMGFMFGVFYVCYYTILLLFNSSEPIEKPHCNGHPNFTNNTHGIKYRSKSPSTSKYERYYFHDYRR